MTAYLDDPAYHAGLEDVRATRLQSRVLEVRDRGVREETLDGVAYTVAQASVEIVIDSYAPDAAERSFFEQGQQTTLLYSVYFVEEAGELRIDSFQYVPEGEAFLPAGEKEALTEAQRTELGRIVRAYVYARYQMDGAADVEEQWAFYQQNAAQAFLERDGITRASLQAFADELAANHASISMGDLTVEIGEQKMEYFDGEKNGFYYWAQADYTFYVEADEPYYAQKGVARENAVRERLYFQLEDGKLIIAGAEFLS